jgi:hypothetical protein
MGGDLSLKQVRPNPLAGVRRPACKCLVPETPIVPKLSHVVHGAVVGADNSNRSRLDGPT